MNADCKSLVVANIVVVSTLWLVLSRENKKRQERIAAGEFKDGQILSDDDLRWRFQT
jgi:hypothetical protein